LKCNPLISELISDGAISSVNLVVRLFLKLSQFCEWWLWHWFSPCQSWIKQRQSDLNQCSMWQCITVRVGGAELQRANRSSVFQPNVHLHFIHIFICITSFLHV